MSHPELNAASAEAYVLTTVTGAELIGEPAERHDEIDCTFYRVPFRFPDEPLSTYSMDVWSEPLMGGALYGEW